MRKISVIVSRGFVESVLSIASDKSVDCWVNAEIEGERQVVQLLVTAESTQSVLDALQTLLGSNTCTYDEIGAGELLFRIAPCLTRGENGVIV